LTFQPLANKQEGKEEDLRGNRHEKSPKQRRPAKEKQKHEEEEIRETKGGKRRE
jgi:hypothetical protein